MINDSLSPASFAFLLYMYIEINVITIYDKIRIIVLMTFPYSFYIIVLQKKIPYKESYTFLDWISAIFSRTSLALSSFISV